MIGDLRDASFCERLFRRFQIQDIYQLAADMGGAGYLFSGEHDADILRQSTQIHLNILENALRGQIEKIFFSSSACIYPMENQEDADHPRTAESTVYPANPDSDYGWEKLYGERLYLAHSRNYGLSIRIARLHNVYGPEGTYKGGREKVLAAICRKVVEAKDGDEIEIWGDGLQTRSFLYIDDCLEGIERLMNSNFQQPLNLGSDQRIRIQDLVECVAEIAGKKIRIRNVNGPVGVRGRSSDNTLIKEVLGWSPTYSFEIGLRTTYRWVEDQIQRSHQKNSRRADSSPLVGEMFYDFFR